MDSPRMWVNIYRIDPLSGSKLLVSRREFVIPRRGVEPPSSLNGNPCRFPPCRCPRCQTNAAQDKNKS